MREVAPAFRLSWIQLRSGRWRAAVTSLAVAVGVGTLVAADLVSRSVTEDIARQAEAETLTAFMSEQLNTGLSAIGWVLAAGAGFLLLNAFSMAVAQRREEIGRLRAVGMTRSQVLAMVLGEAALVGLTGSLAGLLSGIVFARGLVDLIQRTSSMMNALGRAPLSVERLLVAGCAGLVISLVAAAVPAVRAGKVSPLAAQRPEDVAPLSGASRRTTGACLGVCGLLWAGLAIGSPGAWLGAEAAMLVTVACILVWLASVGLCLPALVGLAGRAARRPLSTLFGPVGRLAADNLRRARRRVTLTALTLAIGVAMVVGVSGYMAFWFDELFFRTMDLSLADEAGLGFFPLDVEAGLQAYQQVAELRLPAGLVPEVEEAVAGRASVTAVSFVLAPELSFMGDSYFSFVIDFPEVRDAGDPFFRFRQGDWDRALQLAEQGCAVLVTPAVAEKNDVGLYDRLEVAAQAGRLSCVVAGIGPTFVGASILSRAGLAAYAIQAPLTLTIFPHSMGDRQAILPALEAIAARYPGTWLMDISKVSEMQRQAMEAVRSLMSGMLVVAIVTAALGVVNTAAIGLSERRLELGVLRAVGATRRAVQAVVVLEGLLLGLVGAATGVVAGAGLVLIYIVASGGSAFGFAEFPVWQAGWASVQATLGRGLVSLAAGPCLAALAAWLPARRSIRGSVIETLAPRAEWF